MDNPKLKEVIEILKKENATQDQIEEILSGIIESAYSKLYSEAMLALTEEDLVSIEHSDETQVDEEIIYFYKLRTGKDPDEEVKQFIDNFAEGFLNEYSKNNPSG